MVIAKVCITCKVEKALDCFYRRGSSKGGHRNICKACCAAQNKEWRYTHAEEDRETHRKWRENNRDKIRASKANRKSVNTAYQRNRIETNINYRIAALLRTRVCNAIKAGTKSGSTVDDLGCSIPEFKAYIESKWQPGMTWDNWTRDGWHIDHITALSKFDLTDREQFLRAVHYTNHQPLWWEDNLRKNAA